MVSKKWLGGAAILIPAMLYMMGQIKDTPALANIYHVEYVVDGDTFITREKMNIRFDTLNAPELSDCGGIEAKAALEKILPPGKKVQLNIQARDPNGRQVASVWSGKTWIDEELIKTGWVVYSSSTVDKEHVLQNMDRENKAKQNGVYSTKCTQYENPISPKCNIKGNISGEWEKRKQKMYHMPECANYSTVRVELWRGEQWFCSEKEAAAAGYRKSERCP